MGRFRSFLRRVAKPAAMVTVAGTLALTLTVTSTQKAEASPIAVAPVILAAESIVGGASIPLAMPSLLAASIALHPVGWAIGAGVVVAGLAIGAYHTQDYWLPYITGAFGVARDDKSTSQSTTTIAGYTVGTPSQSGLNITATYTYAPQTTSTTGFYPTMAVIAHCKNSTTGATGYRAKTNSFAQRPMNSGFSSSYTFMDICPAGNTVTGWYMAGTGSTLESFNPNLDNPQVAASMGTASSFQKGPTNIRMGGDMKPAGFDPKGSDVKYKTTVECVSDDGTKSTLTADWTGDNGGAKFPSCAAAGKGHGTGKNKIEGYAPTAPGVPGTVPETLWETTAPAVDPNYEKCDQGRAGSGCRMAITIDGKPCVVGQWECENWSELWKDSTTSTRVGCTYGPYTLSPDACSVMEPAYRPGGAPTTEANVDGNPSTRNNTELNGQPYTPTRTAPAPGSAGAPAPGSDQAMYECWPQGWGVFNPADWIAKPLRCAFEPKKDLTAVTTALAQKAETKAPIGFMTLDMGGPDAAGCPDWNITLPGMASKNVVCGSSFTDAILSVRAPLFGLLATAMVWPLLRSMWYAAIPILRVTPSGGDK